MVLLKKLEKFVAEAPITPKDGHSFKVLYFWLVSGAIRVAFMPSWGVEPRNDNN